MNVPFVKEEPQDYCNEQFDVGIAALFLLFKHGISISPSLIYLYLF